MAKAKRDEEREERITMEIVVDAYSLEEQAMGWYYYLEGTMQFPFTAVCVSKRRISPLKEGTTVEVTGMPPEDECEREMFVEIDWEGDTLAVPWLGKCSAPNPINDPNHPSQITSHAHKQPLIGRVHWGCYAAVLVPTDLY
ncbi:calcium-binding protein [Synechococcales cyanobacterium C]|uniref:Calcium-binding protein n=1 Tax=Petrachloros mirabilis ULC683 TaxID=2781853 RepID=A0A8K2AND8_9CYAN|nr:calcium-binding protein [Petrachloros mirabilis]NCJ05538.1 calcium-binding protein [Petrachloros mirabilis ULC683]